MFKLKLIGDNIMNIGEFIEELSRYDDDYVLVQVSGTGGSYRGYSDSFYLEEVDVDDFSNGITVSELLVRLKYEVIGVCFTGYKGRECPMDESSELYLASYSNLGGIIEGVIVNTRGDLELIVNYDYAV